MNFDCGKLCGAVCCTCNNSQGENLSDLDMGIYLYPGEEKVHPRKSTWFTWSVEDADEYDYPDSWHGKVYYIKCNTPPHCPRERRPFQCRTFPLAPYLDEEGCFSLVYSYDTLPYTCPLTEGELTIDDDFYKATFTVWTHLLRDPSIFDLVEYESEKWRNKSDG